MSKVYLVGAGPGDPELLTLKAKRLLEQADCVLYDNLANPDLLSLAPAASERVYVGKKRAEHAATQEEICGMLIERARRGLNVVRLKGGDPFIFGRGGEEAEALADAGIDFEVVPGVTTPLGIAAYTGVPLTHRDHTSVVTFVTGHDVDHIDWSRVAFAETLVLFMGLAHFDRISEAVIRAGRDPETPAMAVRWATRPDQQVIVGTVSSLSELIRQAGMKPPATIVIGEVVRLRDKLSWFEKLPLFGQRIVVTRAREQAGALAAIFSGLGAEVIELPTIELCLASDYAPLDAAIEKLATYDWLIFTSVNGVRFFLDRLDASPADLRSVRARICAIGPATREALERLHLKVDVTAEEYVAEGLLRAFSQYEIAGARILIARAAVARDVLPKELEARGARVDVVEAYRTEVPAELAQKAASALATKPDWITFTSSSTARNLIDAIRSEPGAAEQLAGVQIASIGPVTSATLKEYGVPVTAEGQQYTVKGLADAVLAASIIKQ